MGEPVEAKVVGLEDAPRWGNMNPEQKPRAAKPAGYWTKRRRL
jgi:hypothetical protein